MIVTITKKSKLGGALVSNLDPDSLITNFCSDDSSDSFEQVCIKIKYWMQTCGKASQWDVDSINFGHKRLCGKWPVNVSNEHNNCSKNLLGLILPQPILTNVFKVFQGMDDNGRWLAINNRHEENPSGDEWYLIRPIIGDK